MKYSRMLCNKKAISEFVLDILSYVLFVTALFFFFVVYKITATTAIERQIKGIADMQSSNSILLNYIRTPVVVEGNNINIAELIRLWSTDRDRYKPFLEKEGKGIIDKMEYDFTDKQTKNNMLKGFKIIINNELELSSQSYEDAFCEAEQVHIHDCLNLGEIIVPISENKALNIIMRASNKPK